MASLFLLIVLVVIVYSIIYFWFFRSIRRQFVLLGNQEYVKNTLSGATWIFGAITSKLIKRMIIIMSILGCMLLLSSIVILFYDGFNKTWAVFTGLGLIVAYGAVVWSNFGKRQKKIKLTKSNVVFSSILGKVWLVVFVLICLTLAIFKNVVMLSPYFQMWFIGFILLIIILSEFHYMKISS
jgi:hypothetical protein